MLWFSLTSVGGVKCGGISRDRASISPASSIQGKVCGIDSGCTLISRYEPVKRCMRGNHVGAPITEYTAAVSDIEYIIYSLVHLYTLVQAFLYNYIVFGKTL